MNDIPTRTPDFYREAHSACNRLHRKLCDHPKITGSAVQVSNYLLKQYVRSVKGYAWPSIDTMVRALNLSKNTVLKSIKFLETFGYFKVKRSEQPHRGTSNEYFPQFLTRRGGSARPPEPAKPPKEGCSQLHQEGCSQLHSRDSVERETVKTVPLSSESKKATKWAARQSARRALVASLEVSEEIRTELKTKPKICDWFSFYKEVYHHNYGNWGLRGMFFPDEMSLDAYDKSLERFREIVVKRCHWKNVIEASQRLILWLSEENNRGGADYGEPCFD